MIRLSDRAETHVAKAGRSTLTSFLVEKVIENVNLTKIAKQIAYVSSH